MFRKSRRQQVARRREAATAEYQDRQDEATNVLRLIQTGLNRHATAHLPTMNFARVRDLDEIIETLSNLAAELNPEG